MKRFLKNPETSFRARSRFSEFSLRVVEHVQSYRRWWTMLREDFAIQTNIRRILIRSNIDYSQLTFGTVRGVVYIQGNFKLAGVSSVSNPKEDEDVVSKTLRSLELKIRSIPGVVDIKFQFLNWKKEKGQWLPTKPVE